MGLIHDGKESSLWFQTRQEVRLAKGQSPEVWVRQAKDLQPWSSALGLLDKEFWRMNESLADPKMSCQEMPGEGEWKLWWWGQKHWDRAQQEIITGDEWGCHDSAQKWRVEWPGAWSFAHFIVLTTVLPASTTETWEGRTHSQLALFSYFKNAII